VEARDARKGATDLPDEASDLLLEGRLNRPKRIETIHEIGFLAQRLCGAF
jgi:hypothetical protein